VIISSGPSALGRMGSPVSSERGRKFSATTAFGITDTMSGSSDARRTVFSLLLGVSEVAWKEQTRAYQV
jgi:hypothetical protein